MPSHATHRIFAKALLGEEHNDVNRLMDITSMFGPRHRKDIFHDPLFILMLTGSEDKFKAAVLHSAIDKFIKEDDVKHLHKVNTKRR